MTPAADDASDIAALRDRLRRLDPPFPEGRFAGRGIVICAGGAQTFTNAYVLISVLRQTLGSRLPIELWHFGPAEISPAMAHLLDGFEVTLRDALPVLAAAGMTLADGWQLKPFALRHSRFAQVLLLDADQVPVSDPAACFDWPEFEQTGAVFWPDIIDIIEANPAWDSLGLTPRRVPSFESGQVLVDKRRHWRALALVEALNAAADIVYTMVYGDKDTFLMGWLLAGASYVQVPHRPFGDERMLVQRDFAGAPLFQHRCNAKWSYAGEQFDLEGFVHMAACLSAIRTLRARWNGVVFNAPDRSLAARDAETRLAGIGTFTVDAPGDETYSLRLLPHGDIGQGRSSDRLNWWCHEEDGLWLTIAAHGRPSLRLRHVRDDIWEGTRYRGPEHPVTLRPVEPPPTRATTPGLIDELLRVTNYPDATVDDAAALVAALDLLGRVDPGLRERLAARAAGGDDALAGLLAALPEPQPLTPPRRDGNIIGRFYRRPDDE